MLFRLYYGDEEHLILECVEFMPIVDRVSVLDLHFKTVAQIKGCCLGWLEISADVEGGYD